MSDEKTEEPTPRRLEEARERGQVAKSQDLVETACMLAVIGVLSGGEHFLTGSLRALVMTATDFVSGDHTFQGMMASLYRVFTIAAMMMGPITLAAVVAAIASSIAQTGIVISFEPVMPNFDSINPANGLKKIFSVKSLIDLGKMTAKAGLLIPVMWISIENMFPLISSAAYQPLGPLAYVLWNMLIKLLAVAFVAYLVIGAADYKLAHWMFIRQNRMSKDEVKRERKQQDGDPQIKRERRKISREIANGPDTSPNKSAVAGANVVVTNPTHYAVALRYVPSECPLPVIVAKGVDAEAALVRRYATEAGVPVVANPPVARALYRVPAEQPIPEAMFEVVAAILRWVESVGAPRTPDSELH